MRPHDQDIPLTHLPVGCPAQIIKIRGGCEMTHRMVEMGLTPGAEVKILQDTGGPLLLAVRDSRIALGRGMAFRVRVSPPSGQKMPGPRRRHPRHARHRRSPAARFSKFKQGFRERRRHFRPGRNKKADHH